MKDNYTYPVIIEENELGGYDLSYPDFDNATTSVAKDVDYIEEAQNFLALLISDYESMGKEVPQSLYIAKKAIAENAISEKDNIDKDSEKNNKVVYINVWMPYHRGKIKEVYVKKTLTIPAWLDILAKKSEVNFSAILVKGLKEELGLISY